MRNRTNELNSNSNHFQVTHRCIKTIINQTFNHSSIHSINPSFNQTIITILTILDAVAAYVEDMVGAAAVDMEDASVSIVGRTDCAVATE